MIEAISVLIQIELLKLIFCFLAVKIIGDIPNKYFAPLRGLYDCFDAMESRPLGRGL